MQNRFHTEEDTTAAPSSQPDPAAKHNKAKRQSSEEPSPPPKPKRAKKEAAAKPAPAKKNAPKKNNKKRADSSSDLSELEESEEEPPQKSGRTALSKKQKAGDSSSDLSELDEPVEEPKKRGRKAISANPQDSDSALSDLGSSSENESEPGEKKPKKTAPRRKPNKASDAEDAATSADETSSVTRKKRKRALPGTKKPTTKRAASEPQPGDASEQETAAESDAGAASLAKGDTTKETALESSKERALPARTVGESKPAVDDESSEMSSVLDEPLPKKKRKTKEPRQPKAKAAVKAAPKELTGDEAEIKKLQGQLVKCGIRKIWGIELKQYGDDSRAKVGHLKKMLSDIGMSGRFSEARAKEIKEQRELMADLQAVQEMDNLWGGAGGPRGRASRSKAKTAVQASTLR